MTLKYVDNGPLIDTPLWWHKAGLQQTATGYGSKLTTRYKTAYGGRLYRVYCICYSNVGTLYIRIRGKRMILRNEAREVA